MSAAEGGRIESMWYESDVVKRSAPHEPGFASELIDARIRELGDG